MYIRQYYDLYKVYSLIKWYWALWVPPIRPRGEALEAALRATPRPLRAKAPK